MAKKNYLVLITTYVKGVCTKIERKFPKTLESAMEMVDKLKEDLPPIQNGNYKIEIVDRF